MGANTQIEWCDHSWSPWRGCTKVSPGCANCYAETLSHRNPAVLGQWGKGKPRVRAKNWNDPMKWDRDARKQGRTTTVFPSLCDIFDAEVPIGWLADFLEIVHDTPHLTWLLLTKRPEHAMDRMREAAESYMPGAYFKPWIADWLDGRPPNGVWIGASVEDQTRADERIPELLNIPAAGRFLSVEPLLGPVDLTVAAFNGADSISGMEGIHWVIVGGESGHGARPCNVKWIRDIIQQCAVAGVPCFVTQVGAVPLIGGHRMSKLHPKGGDPDEWPAEIRVRQFPQFTPAPACDMASAS